MRLSLHSAGNSCIFGFSQSSGTFLSFLSCCGNRIHLGPWTLVASLSFGHGFFFAFAQSRHFLGESPEANEAVNTEQPWGFALEQIIYNKIETDSLLSITWKAVKASLMHLVWSTHSFEQSDQRHAFPADEADEAGHLCQLQVWTLAVDPRRSSSFFDILVLGFRLCSQPLLYATVCHYVSEVSSNVKQIMSDLVEGPTQEAFVRSVVRGHKLHKDHPWPVKCTRTVHELNMTYKLPTFQLCFVLQTSNTDPEVGQHPFFRARFLQMCNSCLIHGALAWSSWGMTTHLRNISLLIGRGTKDLCCCTYVLMLHVLIVKAKHIIGLVLVYLAVEWDRDL